MLREPGLPLVNLTNVSIDYLLEVGKTAKIEFSSATSVPLHINTTDGHLYELRIVGDTSVAGADGQVSLRPNNTTYTDEFMRRRTTNGVAASADNDDDFCLGFGRFALASYTISTDVKSKVIVGLMTGLAAGGTWLTDELMPVWKDTDTVWTSLGTIVFAFNQTGTVYVTRVV